MSVNRVELSGRLTEIGSLRYSPAGIAIVEFKLHHSSEQQEGGMKRRAECTIDCIATEDTAEKIAKLPAGTEISLQGFLAQRSKNSNRTVLHTEHFELIG